MAFLLLHFNFTSFFRTEMKNKWCSLPFFGTFESETKRRSGKKRTYIILCSSVELSSAILIALTTDRIVCVFKHVGCVCICCSTLCSHQLNRKILKQWHFQQSLKFHQKPKRYNSSVTIGNGILIEGTKSTLKHTLAHTHTLAAQVYNKRRKKHPNIIKVKRR